MPGFLCLSPMVPKWIPMNAYLVAHSFGSLCGRFSSKNTMFFAVFGAKPQFSTCFPRFFAQHLHFTQVFQCLPCAISILHMFFHVFRATCQFYSGFSMFSVGPIAFTQVFHCFHSTINILLRFFMVFFAFLCSLLSPMVPKWIPMTGHLVAHSFGSLCGRFSSKNIALLRKTRTN